MKYQLLAFLVHDVINHFPVVFSSTFHKLQRLKNISYGSCLFHFPVIFVKFWNLYNLDFLIIFYLEHIDTPILEDYINDTLKDDRNRSWRLSLFVFKTLPQED